MKRIDILCDICHNPIRNDKLRPMLRRAYITAYYEREREGEIGRWKRRKIDICRDCWEKIGKLVREEKTDAEIH